MDILALSRRIPLLGFFGSSASDDDFADRLNYKYTVAILVVFAFIVTNKHFGHNQINCWVPALFSKNFEEYTNLVCWITNTYYIPFDKQIPNTEAERRSSELRYYQWVAYILLILALLFYLPRIIWRTLSLRSGVDIKDVIEASFDFKSVSKLEKNRKMMEYMIGTIDQYVDDPRRQRANRHMNFFRRSIALTCFMFGKFLGNYLVILYLFVKILYIVNCVGQLFLISILLGRNFYIYGASIFRDIIQGRGYADSEYFPRVTMCKFQVRELGLKNFSHEYNVQCVLPINLFNQQIFTFLWFWYIILLIINTSALLIWVYRFIPINQYNYAIRRIKMLRIRLLETSKATTAAINSQKGGGLSKKTSSVKKNIRFQETTVVSSEYESSEHISQRQQFAATTSTEEVDNRTENNDINDSPRMVFDFEQQRMFPNLPKNYTFEYGNNNPMNISFNINNNVNNNDNGLRLRKDKNVTFSGDLDTSNSEYNEFEPYMLSSSFTTKNYKAFVYEYLESDGMFMLRMVGSNSGDFVCTQVLHNLWKLFLCKKFTLPRPKNKKNDSITDNADQFTGQVYNLNYDTNQAELNTSDYEEEDDAYDNLDERNNTATKASASGKKFQLKSILTNNSNTISKTRKKSSLMSKFFIETKPKTNTSTPLKSKSIQQLHQNKQRLKSQQPQARDENFSIEMKRFQSIKRISRPKPPRSEADIN